MTMARATPLQRSPRVDFAVGVVKWIRAHWSLEWTLAIISLSALILLWEYAEPLGIPGVRSVPPPSEVARASTKLLHSSLYWHAWALSLRRVALGFLAAQVIGVPLGLALAINRNAMDTIFPVVEILRPIPPVAWIPIAIIFWPTRELSVIFIVFLGPFWVVLLNTIGGAGSIDPNFKRAAQSLGSTRRDMFYRIILPATIPSIVTGMAVGMGLAWEMLVAAEMVAGNTGLGYLLWKSFEINAIPQCIVCMVSIGIAGFLSSQLIRQLGRYAAPWQRR
jgi:NitT/TauT family transport system permease protein